VVRCCSLFKGYSADICLERTVDNTAEFVFQVRSTSLPKYECLVVPLQHLSGCTVE
jgi:hypothetical protein